MTGVELPTEGEPVKVVCGDAFEVLDRLPADAAHCVLTDPPYGVGLACHSPDVCTDGSRRVRRRPTAIANDHDTAAAEWVAAWAGERALPVLLFGSAYQPYPGEWRNVLVWDKGPAVGGGGDVRVCWKRTFELIYVRDNRPLREGRDEAVLRVPVNTTTDFEHHPCQKPVPLLRYLIRQLTEPGDVLLDPFAGSGSLGVAAALEGRRALLVELNPDHAAVARKRVGEVFGKFGLFASVGG